MSQTIEVCVHGRGTVRDARPTENPKAEARCDLCGQLVDAVASVGASGSAPFLCKTCLRERLESIRVGNPADESVKMGPLATAAQLRDVREGIGRLAFQTDAVCGGTGDVKEPIGAAAGKGFFVGPVLRVARDAAAATAVHEHEVFGPVATIAPYGERAADAARLVQLGAGGLVRAYTDAVAQALLGAQKVQLQKTVALHCAVPYAMEGMLRRELLQAGAHVRQVKHGDEVEFEFDVTEPIAATLVTRLGDAGQGLLRWLA